MGGIEISKATDLIHRAQRAYHQRDLQLDQLDEATRQRDFIKMERARRRAFEYRDEYYRLCAEWEAETGCKWRVSLLELPLPDEDMEKAFNALADELDVQAEATMQEVVDVWDVWEYMKENGLRVDMGNAFVGINAWSIAKALSNNPNRAVHQVANWVREQDSP